MHQPVSVIEQMQFRLPILEKEYDSLAESMIRGLSLKKDEHLLITGAIHHYPLLAKLAHWCVRYEAFPHLNVVCDELKCMNLTHASEAYLNRLSNSHDRYMASLYDAMLIIDPQFDDRCLAAVPAEKMTMGIKRNRELRDIQNARKVRTIIAALPSPVIIRQIGKSKEFLEKLFKNALLVDRETLMARGMALKNKLANTRSLHITSKEGTDLYMELEPSRRIMIDGGLFTDEMVEQGDITKNLPCGEVYTSPMEQSVEGIAVFEQVPVVGGIIRELKLEFEAGKLKHYSATEGIEFFQKRYAPAIGDKDRIGELGLGINPALSEPLGHPLLDEKIDGSIHLAIGENRMYGGVNNASIHWDLVMLEPDLHMS